MTQTKSLAQLMRLRGTRRSLTLPVGAPSPGRGWVLVTGNVENNLWVKPNGALPKVGRSYPGMTP